MRRVLVGIAPVRVDGVRRPVRIPCLVGVIFWRAAHDPTITIVVKATRSLRTGEFVEPTPFAAGRERDNGAHDFVPSKQRCDIVLNGHVEVPMQPSGEVVPLHVIVRAPGASMAFTVTSDASTRVPLRPPYVVVAGDGVSEVGHRAPRVDPNAEDFHFLPDFDYEVFQAAHPRLRSEAVPPASTITIEGIGAEPLSIEVPPRSARCVVEWTRTAVATDGYLDLDTINVDLDREVVDFTWRGAQPIEGFSLRTAIDRVIVGFLKDDEVADSEHVETKYSTIFSNLSRGTFQNAWEYEDVIADKEPPPLPVEELEMARLEALGGNEPPGPTLTLAEHARISAQLLEIIGSRGLAAPSLEEQQARAEVLQNHGLDHFTWTIEERAHADRLAVVPQDESGGIHAEYGRLFVAAQDSLAPPNEVLPSAKDYATTCVRLRVENPRDVLADAKLSLGAWMRIDRKWQKRMATDEAARDEVDGYLESESEGRGEPRIPEVDDEGRFTS